MKIAVKTFRKKRIMIFDDVDGMVMIKMMMMIKIMDKCKKEKSQRNKKYSTERI